MNKQSKIKIINGNLVDPNKNKIYNINYITIENNIIKDLSINENKQHKKIDNDDFTIIDAKDCYIIPSLIDIHTHLRDPGYTEKEDIISGSESAYEGGFKTICCMANTNPVNDNPETTKYIKEKASSTNIDVLPISACTKGLQGKELVDFHKMVEAGAIAFSDDGMTITDSQVMKDVLIEAKKLNKVVITHSEDTSLLKGSSINEGKISKELGLKGNPSIAEAIMVYRDCMLAGLTECHVHIAHISTAYGVEVVKWAKDKGFPVTAEVCPHHLFLNDDMVKEKGTNAKMAPPLRSKSDVKACREGLIEGIIDIIATDHAPHTIEEKKKDIQNAPFGIIGLETAFSLGYKLTMEEKDFDIVNLVKSLTTTPSNLLNLKHDMIEKGNKAEFFIFNPNDKWIVDVNKLKSKAKNTPFEGLTLPGRIIWKSFNLKKC